VNETIPGGDVNTGTGTDAELERLAVGPALLGLVRCIGRSTVLLGRRRVHQPTQRLGDVLTFGDGTHARVYRETVLDVVPRDPVALVVGFRLRWVRGAGHRLFRIESLLNTPLFIGFPGFVSKLWLTHDEQGIYRGVYQWDGRERAHVYARSLWWVLALVSVRGSIRHRVIPHCTRVELVGGKGAPDGSWWRPVDCVSASS
jgi:hypothetical protein